MLIKEALSILTSTNTRIQTLGVEVVDPENASSPNLPEKQDRLNEIVMRYTMLLQHIVLNDDGDEILGTIGDNDDDLNSILIDLQTLAETNDLPGLAIPRTTYTFIEGNGGSGLPVSADLGDILYFNGTSWVAKAKGAAGTILTSTPTTIDWLLPEGDVAGPSSSTDNAIVRWNGITGKIIQDSGVIIDDSNNITGVANIAVSASVVVGGAIRTGIGAGNTIAFQAYDVDGASYVTFATMTANNNPTLDLAGGVTIGGNYIYRAGGNDVALVDGGTGASLAAPGADRIMFWDESGNTVEWLQLGTNISITGTTLNVATLADASTTVAGKVEIATPAEIVASTRIGGTGAILTMAPDDHASYHRGLRDVSSSDNIIQTDQEKMIVFNSASPINFTIDSLTLGTRVGFINIGAGTVTFVNGSGVTLAGTTSLAGGTNASSLIVYKTTTTPVMLTGGTTVTGAALTKTDDTNVTLTLGGSPTTALVNAASITVGWSGTLAYSRFVNGAGLSVVGRSANSSGVQADITGTANQILRVNGAGTSLGFGSIDISQSATIGSSILPIANGGTGSSSVTYYLLASGGTAAGVNNFISNAASQFLWNGSWTATATGQYHSEDNPTITLSNNTAHIIGVKRFGGALTAGVNNQVLRSVVINTTYAYGAFTRANYSQLGLDIRDSSGNGFKFYTDAFTNTNNSFQIINPSGVTTAELVVDNSGFNIVTNSTKTMTLNSGSIFRILRGGSRILEHDTVTLDVSRSYFGPAWSGTAVSSTASQLGSNANFSFQGRGWTGAAAVTTYLIDTFDASTATNLLFTSDRRFWNGSAMTDIWRVSSTGLMFIGGITTPTAVLDVAASTTARASYRIRSGTAPTSPNDGDNWYDGTNYYARVGSVDYVKLKGFIATATINFGSILAQASEEQTVTVNGVADGDDVIVSPPDGSFTAGLVFTARGSAANTVKVQCVNTTLGTIDPNSGSFKLTVIKH